MVDPRRSRPSDLAALVALADGTCMWPSCTEPVMRFVEDRWRMNVDRAHIRAARPGGPRYDPRMTDEERRDYGNLILLVLPITRWSTTSMKSTRLGRW